MIKNKKYTVWFNRVIVTVYTRFFKHVYKSIDQCFSIAKYRLWNQSEIFAVVDNFCTTMF